MGVRLNIRAKLEVGVEVGVGVRAHSQSQGQQYTKSTLLTAMMMKPVMPSRNPSICEGESKQNTVTKKVPDP